MKVEPIREKDLIQECLNYLENKNERDKIMFAIGIYTGLRVGDILRLRVKDVYHKNRIVIKQEKTEKYIEIPINKELKKMLNNYCEDKTPTEFLIKSRVGYNQPISKDRAYKIFREMSEELGIEGIGTHTMRKTCGYHLYYSGGKDIVNVMNILGHKEPSMTLRYIGVTQDTKEKAIKKLSFI